MLLAVLKVTDFAIIAVIMAVLLGRAVVTSHVRRAGSTCCKPIVRISG
ncbi:MAG: hypothetical protein ACKO2P_15580 [Planctomycetota bacterium]